MVLCLLVLLLSLSHVLSQQTDNDERVSTNWSGLGHISPERYSVTPAMRGSDGSYTGTLTISPLAEGDDGTLSCTGTVTGGTESQSDTDTAVINVMCKFEDASLHQCWYCEL